jgi:hypothetical protein
MGLHQQIGPAPMPAVARILARYDRPKIEAFLAIAIDLLDTMDPDPELEDDDPAGQCDEDGVNTEVWKACGGGPGCVISDNDHGHDGREPEDGY